MPTLGFSSSLSSHSAFGGFFTISAWMLLHSLSSFSVNSWASSFCAWRSRWARENTQGGAQMKYLAKRRRFAAKLRQRSPSPVWTSGWALQWAPVSIWPSGSHHPPADPLRLSFWGGLLLPQNGRQSAQLNEKIVIILIALIRQLLWSKISTTFIPPDNKPLSSDSSSLFTKSANFSISANDWPKWVNSSPSFRL